MTIPGEFNPLEGNRFDGIVEYAQVVGLLSPQVTPDQADFIEKVQNLDGVDFDINKPEVAERMAVGEAICSVIRSQVEVIFNEKQTIDDHEFEVAARELYRLYTEQGRGFNFGHKQAVGCVALRFIDSDPDAKLYNRVHSIKEMFKRLEER